MRMHYLVSVSHFAKYGTKRPLIVWWMLTNVQKSSIPKWWIKWKSDPESIRGSRSPPKFVASDLMSVANVSVHAFNLWWLVEIYCWYSLPLPTKRRLCDRSVCHSCCHSVNRIIDKRGNGRRPNLADRNGQGLKFWWRSKSACGFRIIFYSPFGIGDFWTFVSISHTINGHFVPYLAKWLTQRLTR